MFELIEIKPTVEKVVLIGLITQKQGEKKINEFLDELDFLVDTAGGEVQYRFVQRLDRPNPRTFVGSGKLEEIAAYIHAEGIDTAVFDDELNGSQIRNIQEVFQCKVLDRNNLILDIFARRAHTAHARTQVELAQYQYLLPRLTRMWTHLSKQRGGIGMRGPGEKEIETDRRIIRDKIALLKGQLVQIDKQKTTQRSNRGNMVRVALIGYTNVGKSTLMNVLSKSDVFAENKLFATLDTTVRKVVIGNLPFLLSDTVGFIRKLPHSLVEAFKSTLDEVRESDILVHVVDISHRGFEEQIDIVNQTLAEIQANDKPILMIFNKIDALPPHVASQEAIDDMTFRDMETLKRHWVARNNEPAVFISATQKENLEELRDVLYYNIMAIHSKRYPNEKYLF
ncbi:MAG: GTPase HflX [Bacteroidales bacterium]|nr:GTPase HflX [Bacteroidales bacterium]MDZ4205050.1 GTPase HflX [Bacteroidales bacterium]